MEGDVVKRLMWSGLQAGLGAVAGIVMQRVATLVWRRVCGHGRHRPFLGSAAGPGPPRRHRGRAGLVQSDEPRPPKKADIFDPRAMRERGFVYRGVGRS